MKERPYAKPTRGDASVERRIKQLAIVTINCNCIHTTRDALSVHCRRSVPTVFGTYGSDGGGGGGGSSGGGVYGSALHTITLVRTSVTDRLLTTITVV